MMSFSLFGHCHGNCSARQIYFAPIHFLWVSMNKILGFLSSRLGLVLSACGALKGYTSASDAHPRKHTHTRTTCCRGHTLITLSQRPGQQTFPSDINARKHLLTTCRRSFPLKYAKKLNRASVHFV